MTYGQEKKHYNKQQGTFDPKYKTIMSKIWSNEESLRASLYNPTLAQTHKHKDQDNKHNKDTKSKKNVKPKKAKTPTNSKNDLKKQTLDIVIIHYNTPRLTECLVESIHKFIKKPIRIYIFDNSDNMPFTKKMEDVTILDNTNGQYANFDKLLEQYPNRFKSIKGLDNAFGSVKHCYSVQTCIDLLDKDFLLMDSDILLKKDPSGLCKKDVIFASGRKHVLSSEIIRSTPFLCWLNVKLMKKNDISYFDDNRMLGLMKDGTQDYELYDTGVVLYQDTMEKGLKYRIIKNDDYFEHYRSGSWRQKDRHQYEHLQDKADPEEWLAKYKNLWSDDV